MQINPGLSKLSSLSKVRQREVVLPTAKITVVTRPLLVGDDIAIRSSIVSPDTYDSNICQLLYNHTEFPNNSKPDYQTFVDSITIADKQMLIWGILASTYREIKDEKVVCNKCKEENIVTIPYDDLIHDDSITIWTEPAPPKEYIRTCTINIGTEDIDRLEVDLGYLPISYRLAILSMISIEKIRENFNTLGTILSLPEQLASITKEIRIISPDNEISRINNIQELHIAYKNFLTYDIMELIQKEYSYFDKYNPRFYTHIQCPKCGNMILYEADMEVSLFRNYFHGLGFRE